MKFKAGRKSERQLSVDRSVGRPVGRSALHHYRRRTFETIRMRILASVGKKINNAADLIKMIFLASDDMIFLFSSGVIYDGLNFDRLILKPFSRLDGWV